MPICPRCGQENPDVARFCLACGSTLAEPRGGGEERKTVTVLFCDLVGFTALADNADPEDVRATLRPYHDRLLREIERFGGTVEKFIGDAVMAVFGAPIVHEDDPERAVRSALSILDAIDDLNRAHPRLELAVRIGINTGEAVVSLDRAAEREGLVAGDVVNTASRLESIAPTGAAVVGETTYSATRHLFDFEPLQPFKVKGKARPLRAWRVMGPVGPDGPHAGLLRTAPFVNRLDEIEVLRLTFARARREASAQLATLLGEPGVGKSRLVQEFSASLLDLGEAVSWREGRCLPYGEGITFWALGEIVKAQAGILESDPEDQASRKLEASVGALIQGRSEQDWLISRLAPLVGLGTAEGVGVAERTEAFTAWRMFLEAIAATGPLVLVFEDLHWADSALLDFLDHLVEWSSGVPIVLICTARPELYERNPGWGGGKRNSTTISLSPLPEDEITRLISGLLAGSELPEQLHDLLLERAGGNPLFAEEFVGMLSDRGSLRKGGEPGRPEVAGLAFPDSVQAIIAARLDTLPPGQKSLIQDAAVVGKVFWSGALSFMAGLDEGTVRQRLHELTRKELVRPARTSSVQDQVEYAFWHFLIRDVAYGQIPRGPRAKKHQAIAQWIEQLAGERVADHAELLAYHYRQALDLTRASGGVAEVAHLQNRARHFLVMAGDRAMALDVSRAAEHYHQALDLASVGDPDRGRVMAKAAESAAVAGRLPEAEQLYEEAIGELKEGGDVVLAGDATVRLANLLWYRGETARCRSLLIEAIELLEAEPPGPELANAYTEHASDQMAWGLFDEALAWAEKALVVADDVGAEEQRARALAVRGPARWYRGDLAGLDDLRRGLDLALELGMAREAGRMHGILAEMLWVSEGPRVALETAGRGIDLAERRGSVGMAMAILALTLRPLFDLGEWDQLLGVAGEVVGWSGPHGERYFAVLAESYRARVLLLRGHLSRAIPLAVRLGPAAREIGDPWILPMALAVAAQAEMARNKPEDAIALVEEFGEATEGRPGWYRIPYLPAVVRICVSAGRIGLAERLADDVPIHARRHKLSLRTARAILQEARGDLPTAAATYADMAEEWRDFGFVLEQAQASLGRGRCLVRLGRAEGADPLRKALSLFEQLGTAPLKAEAESLLGQTVALLS